MCCKTEAQSIDLGDFRVQAKDDVFGVYRQKSTKSCKGFARLGRCIRRTLPFLLVALIAARLLWYD